MFLYRVRNEELLDLQCTERLGCHQEEEMQEGTGGRGGSVLLRNHFLTQQIAVPEIHELQNGILALRGGREPVIGRTVVDSDQQKKKKRLRILPPCITRILHHDAYVQLLSCSDERWSEGFRVRFGSLQHERDDGGLIQMHTAYEYVCAVQKFCMFRRASARMLIKACKDWLQVVHRAITATSGSKCVTVDCVEFDSLSEACCECWYWTVPLVVAVEKKEELRVTCCFVRPWKETRNPVLAIDFGWQHSETQTR